MDLSCQIEIVIQETAGLPYSQERAGVSISIGHAERQIIPDAKHWARKKSRVRKWPQDSRLVMNVSDPMGETMVIKALEIFESQSPRVMGERALPLKELCARKGVDTPFSCPLSHHGNPAGTIKFTVKPLNFQIFKDKSGSFVLDLDRSVLPPKPAYPPPMKMSASPPVPATSPPPLYPTSPPPLIPQAPPPSFTPSAPPPAQDNTEPMTPLLQNFAALLAKEAADKKLSASSNPELRKSATPPFGSSSSGELSGRGVRKLPPTPQQLSIPLPTQSPANPMSSQPLHQPSIPVQQHHSHPTSFQTPSPSQLQPAVTGENPFIPSTAPPPLAHSPTLPPSQPLSFHNYQPSIPTSQPPSQPPTQPPSTASQLPSPFPPSAHPPAQPPPAYAPSQPPSYQPPAFSPNTQPAPTAPTYSPPIYQTPSVPAPSPPILQDSPSLLRQITQTTLPTQQTPTSLHRYEPNELQRGTYAATLYLTLREFPHLASGSYGTVYKGRVAGIDKLVVIKDMNIMNENSVNEWRKEISVMSQNASAYICKVYGYASQGHILTIVMEYMQNGDLFSILHTKAHLHPLSTLQRMRMARHSALGVAWLHKNGIIHRDIKSMNILVTDDYACKLTDFGTAKLANSQQSPLMTVNAGTPLWMAPEVRVGQYSFPADIFRVGPFRTLSRKLAALLGSTNTHHYPTAYFSLLPCVHRDPAKRPTAIQVVQYLDHLIKKIVTAVKLSLPEQEQQALALMCNPSGDDLESEILLLYKHLLTKPAQEVDDMINAAFAKR